MSYLRSLRIVWDAGLAVFLCLFLFACVNQHDTRAEEASARADGLRSRALEERDPELAAALREKAEEWDARAAREREAAQARRDEQTDTAMEWAALAAAMLTGGGGAYVAGRRRGARARSASTPAVPGDA